MIEQKNPAEVGIQVEDATPDTPIQVADAMEIGELLLPLPEPPKPKKRRFLKGLSIYALLLAAVVAVALWFFYSFLDQYEAKTPNAALNNYLNRVAMEDYESLYATSGFEETPLNTKKQYISYLASLYDNAEDLSYREQVTTDKSIRRFSLYSGNTKLSNLTLMRSPEGDGTAWYVSTEITYQEPYHLFVSEDVRLTINDTDVNLLALEPKEVQTNLFPTVDGAELTLPVVYEYVLEDLFTAPILTGLTLNGDQCTIRQEGQNLYVVAPTAEEERQVEETLAIEVATTYAKFVARDASRTKLLSYIHKDSELYQTIRNFSNTWFNTHESYEFRDITVTQFQRYAANDFSCVDNFQPVYVYEGKTIQAAPVHYRMSFLNIEGEWMLYSLTQTVADTAGTTDSTTTDATTTTEATLTTTTATP